MIKSNVRSLVERLSDRFKSVQFNSPNLKEALVKIALRVINHAKINIRRQGLIDTGNLLNSIMYEYHQDAQTVGVNVGSFNVPYAAIHEFGGDIRPKKSKYLTIPLDPRYRRLKASNFNLSVTKRNHKLFLIDEETGQLAYYLAKEVRIPPRPYLRPAVMQNKEYIIDTLRSLIK